MATVTEIREQLAESTKRIKALGDEHEQIETERALTEEETRAWDEAIKGHEALQAKLRRAEKLAELDTPEAKPKPTAEIRQAPAIHTRDKRPPTLLRAILGQAQSDKSFRDVELRQSAEIQEKFGLDSPRGVYITPRMLMGAEEVRNINYGAGSGSGEGLVATDLMPQDFIEALRPVSVVVQAGARMMPGLVGNVDVPRQSGVATAVWLTTETGSTATDTDQAFDTITLVPHTVGIRADITRRMLKQSTPAVEQLVRDDVRQQIGLAIDAAAIVNDTASDANAPSGIFDTARTGVASEGLAADNAPSWQDVVNMEVHLGQANALRGSLAYITTPTCAGNMKTTVVDSGSGRFVAEMMGPMGSAIRSTVNGYPLYTTTAISTVTTTGTPVITFGNFADMLIGMWQALDLFADPYSLGNTGALVVRGFQDVDINLRHAESFSKGTNP